MNKVFFLMIELVKLKVISGFCYNEFNYINVVNTFTKAKIMKFIKGSNDSFTEQELRICMECESKLSKD